MNHHGEDLIRDRVALLTSWGAEVVVVDNSSTYDGPGTVVDSGANLGFGRACNLGVQQLPPHIDAVCFHNPDVEIDEAGLRALHARLRSQTSPGVVAPGIRTGMSHRPAGFRYPSFSRQSAIVIVGAVRARRARRRGRDLPREDRAGSSNTRGRRFGSGACLIVDRSAFESVGGFDEHYFLYAEDLAIWDSLRRAGFDIGFAPDVTVLHHRGTGGRASNTRRELLRWAGVEYFLSTRVPRRARLLRFVHRTALRTFAFGDPVLATRLDELWRAGAPPAEVLDEIAAQLARTSDDRRD